MRLNTNLSALSAFNVLASSNKSLQRAIKQVSTGLRINSASDDAAGLAISEKMRSQIGGLDAAIRNTQDGISLLQTAEGALSNTTSILQRMRELSVQAANGTLTQQDRSHIQEEIDQLKTEINRIAGTTKFNKKKILNGTAGIEWSSTSSGVKAIVNGSVGRADIAEGNYKLDINVVDEGQAQVQKSNIMHIASLGMKNDVTTITSTHVETIRTFTEREVLVEKEEPISIIIDGGNSKPELSSIKKAENFDEITSGWDFDSSTKELTIKSDGVYRIVGTDSTKSTQNHIVIAEGVKAQIFLDGVNIDVSGISGACAFDIKAGATAEIFLANTNRLTSANGRAGIETRGAMSSNEAIASVIINSANSEDSSSLDGELIVTGGYRAAAIGGPGTPVASNGRSGSITINGGTITAKGGTDAAGIGGGYTSGYNGGGTITINGGDVTAISPLDAGIGTGLCGVSSSGANNDGTVITITGGRIKAKGGGGAGAGIGGGLNFDSGVIKVKSGITIIESGPLSEQNFLIKAKEQDANNTGSFIYAVKGADSTAAIGYGKSAVDTPGGVDLDADIEHPAAPDVPKLPTAMVKEKDIVSDEDVEYQNSYDSVTTEENASNITYSKLSEISQFYNASGTFIVSQPQTLTITQGNGQSASLTLYETDTLYDVADKINNAIADSLGQRKYTDTGSKFCTISDGTNDTSESVYDRTPIYDDDGNITGYDISATLLVRSVKPGKDGELSFSGDEDLLNALGFNTIQASKETTFSTDIQDAHTGAFVARNIKTTGSTIHGAIQPNIDVEFDAMTGLQASWDNREKRYTLNKAGTYSTVLHIKDSSINLQVGANEGERFAITLGDMSCQGLDLESVNVRSQDSASRAISVIDNALDKVSTQRAQLGASQNTLEHTISRLETASGNLSQSESRIRDADIARVMIALTNYRIMNQTAESMLAQANQLPQQVLSLIR